MTFADLGLSDELLRAVGDAGYTEPTPIQAEAIPPVLMMKDLVGIAQTGTGKTASFVLPMIDILSHGRSRALMPRSLILEPTRELAAQVAENFEKYGKYQKLEMALLIGGVSMGDQMKALEKGVDVLIATPGRLMDLFDRGKILLSGCDILVIDEADRMLDMGFIPDIESICQKLPTNRQTLLFSATMPPPIKKLSDKFLSNPKHIEVARPATAATNIDQRLIETSPRGKKTTLKKLLRSEDITTAIIFANRKTTVRDLQKSLHQDGFKAGQIHGDMSQPERMRELDLFKSGDINILVASDVAARGLDIKGVSHVFNYDAPWHPDDYVHRIGRTGRAGAAGTAITLVTKADEEAIENIEKLTGQTIARGDDGGGKKPAAKSKPSEDRDEAADDKPKRKPRSRSKPKSEPKDDSPAPEKSEKPKAKKTAEKKPKKAPAKKAPDSDGGDDEWNGPMPGFLNVKLGE
ncbi:DEAD/DEAH box helicase [Parasphingopyxis sp. CP4]|uniref:DEAD/DEAH box helicase n=1 Tax=Parasphingopyxis sp. CP4 TaxID=2724527 RepID=UPI0015A19C1A|nr:DEAD/DEAH box helicase [Parasphingopyxis sp. CP4]QLC21094.1 DEAD/DEAH box helicase [Parasphingopyxis sp. CP4]